MNSMTPPPGPWVEDWLSAGRFGVYLTAASGDRQRALDLYEWNTTMSAAVLHDLAHLEVAIRNAYDRALVARQRRPLHWTADLGRYFPYKRLVAQDGTVVDLNERPRRQVHDAIRNAGGASTPPGKVVAELMFGFWRYLTTRNHDSTLWVPYLRHAFPVGLSGSLGARFNRGAVDAAMGELHTLRNRVAHHEALLLVDLTTRRLDMVRLLDFINPQLSAFVQQQSTWATVEGQRP